MKKSLEEDKEHQRRMNPVTLQKLIESGSNANEIHCLINVFHVYDEGDLNELVSNLQEMSYHPQAPEHFPADQDLNSDEYWLVEATRMDTLSIDTLHQMTDDCVDAVAGLNAIYDGWYTQVTPTVH